MVNARGKHCTKAYKSDKIADRDRKFNQENTVSQTV
jgi:hypothetical protein